ncbi:uncharacterized protein LODBEIA_P54250 [Lodderomyces beijingensis]|uniref:Thioesterase domain-containing protein n=1 Tax=Lodderomyces beijingensis TaxID=1775926 RepID=A0ABP0ZSU3_9ASCO
MWKSLNLNERRAKTINLNHHQQSPPAMMRRLPSSVQPVFKNRTTQLLRHYATRSGNVSPLAHLPPRRPNKRWINWYTTTAFLLLGGFISYRETLFDYYESYTHIDERDPKYKLLPIQLEFKLKNLPIYQTLAHPRNHQWFKLSSWENLDRNVLDNQSATATPAKNSENNSNTSPAVTVQDEYHVPELTNQTLAKPGGILIKPVTFHNIQTDENVTIVHAGYRLCGYPFIIHGGIIATLLNETFKRSASLNQHTLSNLKGDFMVENLVINYKSPTFANQFLIVKTKMKDGVSLGGKVVELESVIEDQRGKVLVRSSAVLRDTGRATVLSREADKKKKKTWW